ncbi:MAG: class I SAM-dependent methyltransferase [Flavobacteriales bacterium]|nr:class I SAM-dependent methyltransferase [Flavobacteriales bacterium]
MNFLPESIEDYIKTHTETESEILKDINHETWEKVLNPRMLSGHVQGRILSMLSHMINPNNILEIGTFTGYSAICLAEGLQENGCIDTIDNNEELESLARKNFKRSGLEKKINLMVGDATQIIPTLTKMYDLVFIDADKINYSLYYELIFDKVKTNGYIIADNVLWNGKVTSTPKNDDIDTLSIINFNAKIQSDNRVQNVLFGVRDGLMVIRKLI